MPEWDDLAARMRAQEETTNGLREKVAALQTGYRGMERAVDAFEHAARQLNAVEGCAEKAMAKAVEASDDVQEMKDEFASSATAARANKWQIIGAVISIVGLILTLATLIFFILQFAGAGVHG